VPIFKKNSLQKSWIQYVFFAVLSVFLFVGCSKTEIATKKATSTQMKAQKEEKEPIDVVATKLEQKEIFDPREFGGRLKSKNESPLIALRPGLISRCFKEVGEEVKRGQPILAVSAVDGVGLKPTIIRAPLTGVISQLSKTKGQLVEKGQRIGMVSEKDGFETTVYITDADLASLKVRDQVDIQIQLGMGKNKAQKKVIQATVLSKALQPEPNSTGYAVRIGLNCNQKACEGVRLGSFVKMILKENFRQGFRLPLNVLQNNQTQVLLVDRDQKARWQVIELGSAFGDEVEISTGLEEPFAKGWLLVTGRSKKPKEGDSLSVTTKEDSLKEVLDSPISKSDKTKKPSKG
jgi:biotin carboxyl carrier protein